MALSAGAVVAQFDGDFKGLNKGLQDAQSKVDNFTGNIKKAGNKIGEVFGNIGNVAMKYGKILGVAGAAATVFGIKTAADLQSLSTSFETLTGSAEKGRKVFTDLKKMGATTPFEVGDLAKATQTMLAFGIEVDKTEGYLKMLGDVSMGNKDKLGGLALAFSQVQSTGRLMGQDLLQMINQGFNPLTIISQKTGRSMRDLKKDMEDGKITTEMVTDAFKTATSEGGLFYKGMERGSKTLSGTFSTLMDNIKLMSAGLAGLADDGTIVEGSLLDLVQKGVNVLNEALGKIDWVAVGQAIQNNIKKAIDDTTIAIQNTINWYNQYKDTINFVMELIVSFGSAFLILRGIVIGYNIVMAIANALTGGFAIILAFLTSPITLVGIALGVLIFLGIQLYKNWSTLTAQGTWLGNSLRFVKEMALGAWNSIRDFINTLSQIKMPSGLQKIIDSFNIIKEGFGKDINMIGNLFKKGIPGHANGVRNFAGGLSIVGERGPELVNLPKGADVFSNEESKRMTGGQGITIETMNIKSGVDWEVGASYLAQKLRLS
jgi:tape measure domain-containing protein